jgi:hypothetical protein
MNRKQVKIQTDQELTKRMTAIRDQFLAFRDKTVAISVTPN